MLEDHRLSKVAILIQHNKLDEAERMLKDLLQEDPNSAHYLSLLAEVYLEQGKHEEANQIVDNAIGRAPDVPVMYFIKSRILLQMDQYDAAEKYISQAIQLDPNDADYFALSAAIKLSRKKYQEALELADQSLAIDSENLLGLNTRSTALLKLNRKDDSFKTIEGALREDPNNAYTHSNYGWGLLEKGNHKKALEHFREALANDPNYSYAQAGMIEALKAANPVYRLFLKYSFWINNLTARYQWAVIIGFYLGQRVLRGIANSNEALRPFLTPLIFVMAFVAFSTWVIEPVSNLFLRFNRYGQYLLSKKEKMSSNFVAASFLTFITGLILLFVQGGPGYLALTVYGFAMMVPLSTMFMPSKYKHGMLVYAIGMAVIGLLAILEVFATGELTNTFTTIFVVGFIGFQWIANFIMIKGSNQ